MLEDNNNIENNGWERDEENSRMPVWRGTERKSAGCPPIGYGFEQLFLFQEGINDVDGVPGTFDEVINRNSCKEWKRAVGDEMKLLEKLGTKTLLNLLKDREVIQTKWVFDLKRFGNGNICRCKARLIAKEVSKIPGVHFLEVFSPVSKYSTM